MKRMTDRERAEKCRQEDEMKKPATMWFNEKLTAKGKPYKNRTFGQCQHWTFAQAQRWAMADERPVQFVEVVEE